MAWLRKKKVLYRMQRRQVKRKANNVDPCDATTETNMIDDLPESLFLFEIFSRLHNPRDIIVCKSVSKRWNDLLSSSSFHYNQSLALILNTLPPCATNDLWKGFNLNNYVDPEFDNSPVCVLASYKDVLLCLKYYSSRRKTRSQFYIVNPVTKRWTRLPGTHKVFSALSSPIGLSFNESKDTYYVVKLEDSTSTRSRLDLHVLDSKRGQWKLYSIKHPRWSQRLRPTQCQALNFNKALHWLARDGDGPIVAYNPNYSHKLIIIHRSQEMRHASHGDGAVISETLTVSMGHLRIIQLISYPFPSDHHHLSVWTLVDYEQSLWKQEHEAVYFRDMVSGIPWIQDYMREYNQHDMSMNKRPPPETTDGIIFPHPLLCHPHNPLLLYLYLPESIVSLHVPTKRLHLITTDIKRGERANFCRRQVKFDMVIPMTLHLDPSLVSDHEGVLQPRHP